MRVTARFDRFNIDKAVTNEQHARPHMYDRQLGGLCNELAAEHGHSEPFPGLGSLQNRLPAEHRETFGFTTPSAADLIAGLCADEDSSAEEPEEDVLRTLDEGMCTMRLSSSCSHVRQMTSLSDLCNQARSHSRCTRPFANMPDQSPASDQDCLVLTA